MSEPEPCVRRPCSCQDAPQLGLGRRFVITVGAEDILEAWRVPELARGEAVAQAKISVSSRVPFAAWRLSVPQPTATLVAQPQPQSPPSSAPHRPGESNSKQCLSQTFRLMIFWFPRL